MQFTLSCSRVNVSAQCVLSIEQDVATYIPESVIQGATTEGMLRQRFGKQDDTKLQQQCL